MGCEPPRLFVVHPAHHAGGVVVGEGDHHKMKNKSIPLLLLAALWAAFATGCNTTKGLGKDIEKAGDKIQDAAK